MQNDSSKSTEQKTNLSITFADWLKSQLDIWSGKGILNSEQRNNIENLYVWPKKEQQEKTQKAPISIVTVLEIIGTLLIGLGVISIIAYNWPRIQNYLKLIIIIVTFLSAHLFGLLLLIYKPTLKKTGLSLIFLGNLLYGGGIWLVAQMYHLQYPFAFGFFIWALGVIPFVYILRSKLNFFLALFLFIQWTFTESFGIQRPHLTFLFLLLALLIPLSYYLKSSAGLAVCLICSGIWLLINNIFWFGEDVSVYLFLPVLLYGILLLATSNLHLRNDKLKQYKSVYYNLGCLIMAVSIFLMPFFGTAESKLHTLSNISVPFSFWVCSGIMLLAIWIIILLTDKQLLDDPGKIINKLLPLLLFISVFSLIMPYLRSIMVLNLLPILIVTIALWYFTKSKMYYTWILLYIIIWLPFCLIQWEQPLLLFLLYSIFSLMCYILGWSLAEKQKDLKYGTPFKILGLLLLYFTLYITTFSSIIKTFVDDYKFPRSFDFWFLFFLFYIISFYLLKSALNYRYPKYKDGILPEEKFIIPILFTIPVVVFFVFANNLTGLRYTILSNLFFLILLVFYLISGYRRRETYLKILSVIFLVLLVYSRYFEIELSLLHKSLLFIISGIIIFAAGIIFEKNKEKVAIIE